MLDIVQFFLNTNGWRSEFRRYDLRLPTLKRVRDYNGSARDEDDNAEVAILK